MFIFIAGDFHLRYHKTAVRAPEPRFKIYLGFLILAILLILIRCIYRIDELSDGYTGPLFHQEGVFYGLESV